MHDRTNALIDLYASVNAPESFALSPDGQTVALVLHVNGYSQIFTVPTSAPNWPRRITATLSNCTDPHWSPDSKKLAFVCETAIWTVNADGTDARLLTDHPAGNSDPRWSPDGTRIAFYSRRRGWEHIWTIPAEGGKASQLLKGEFDGDDLAWSPDCQWLAFCSMSEQDLTTNGVYIVHADGGEPILLSPRASWAGSPHFSPDGRTIAYLSDQDGWFHVYVHDLATSVACQLTRGEYEDGGSYFFWSPQTGPIFSSDGAQLAFTRHRAGNFEVWVADVQSGNACCISKDAGSYHLLGWEPDNKSLVIAFEDAGQPAELFVLTLTGQMRRLTRSINEEIRAENVIYPKWVSYQASDGATIHAALFRPPRETGSPSPAVIYLHGGPNSQFSNSFNPMPQLLAHAGYIVLAPNYRGSTGYGRAFETANFRDWGGRDAQDVIEAASWLQDQSLVDPSRMAVMGSSYGGFLTLNVVTLAPDLFCAAIDLYGDTDLAESFRLGDRFGRLDMQRQMGKPEESPDTYYRASPLYRIRSLQAPLLIMHGNEDTLVSPQMSRMLIERLQAEGKYFESCFYDHEGHGIKRPEARKDAWRRIIAFLNRHCANTLAG